MDIGEIGNIGGNKKLAKGFHYRDPLKMLYRFQLSQDIEIRVRAIEATGEIATLPEKEKHPFFDGHLFLQNRWAALNEALAEGVNKTSLDEIFIEKGNVGLTGMLSPCISTGEVSIIPDSVLNDPWGPCSVNTTAAG